MISYLPLGIGGAVAVAALVLMFTPTECFVMQNYPPEIPSFSHLPPELDVLRLTFDSEGNILFAKKVFSNLEGNEVIVVDDPPDSALDALLFWVNEGGITVSPDVWYRSYHVECTDPVSRGVYQMFPSMFPNSVYESDIHTRRNAGTR